MQYRILSNHVLLLAGISFLAVAAPAGATADRTKPESTPPPAAKQAPRPAMAWTPPELELLPGETVLATLLIPSPTGKPFIGVLRIDADKGLTVQPDARWTGRMPAWGVKLFPKVTAAADMAGTARVVASLTPGGSATLTVKLRRPELKVLPGQHELRIWITNPLRGRTLKGRVAVSNPDRFLGSITSRGFEIPVGETQELQIPLPGASPSEGQSYAFTVTLQTWAGYKEQKTFQLQFPPQKAESRKQKAVAIHVAGPP